MTALENVSVGTDARHKTSVFGAIMRTPRLYREEHDAVDRGMALLEFVGIGARAAEKASNLPYGDQRRLEIARALATEPKLLCLDEPAADRLEQQGDEQRDDQARHDEGRQDDAGLQRAAPAVPRGPSDLGGPARRRVDPAPPGRVDRDGRLVVVDTDGEFPVAAGDVTHVRGVGGRWGG